MREKIMLRAKMLETIRAFFLDRSVLEVETPLLCSHSVTDVYVDSFRLPLMDNKNRFLQTSPEYAMKRLLVENSGDIFQISKAFRVDEPSSKHNPEFTMLEWYRLGFDHHKLMDEVDEFLIETIDAHPASRFSYQEIYEHYLNFNPFESDRETVKKIVASKDIISKDLLENLAKFDLLDLLFTHFIETQLGRNNSPAFIYDFPPEQAALAKIRPENPAVGERFEVYMRGMELANGFHELANPEEQVKRFQEDQKIRASQNKFIPEIDHYFIEALKKGLPSCAGVALGIDRLLMLKAKTSDIKDILCFPWEII